MPSKNFCKLIDEICKVVNIANSQSLYEAADLEIDQTKFTLRDGSSQSEDAVAFYCDFGLVPPKSCRADALQRLLELNLVMFGLNTPVFSINGQNNHVLMMARIPMKDMSAEMLLNTLAKYSAKAKKWQKTYYLTTEEKSSKQTKQHRYLR